MKVTWLPDADEAFKTTAFGREWEANIAQDVDPNEGKQEEEFTERVSNPRDGTWKLVTRKRMVSLLERIKRNQHFQVEGDAPRKRGRPPKPKTFPNAAIEHATVDAGKLVSALPGEPVGS